MRRTLLLLALLPPLAADAGDYGIVVSHQTLAQPAWAEVVETLREKHDGTVMPWDAAVTEAVGALAEARPRHACFVATPEEAGRDFVVAVHRLTRQLDDDPYGDVVWGILTGYDAADALRIARQTEPLTVRRCLSGTSGQDLSPFEAALKFNEGTAGGYWEKEPGQEPMLKDSPADSTKDIVEAFNTFRPDYFVTSGHATERDWQIGYSYRDGQLRCEDGQLFGLDTRGARHDIHSPNPKVHVASGNCLIGHIDRRDCMALALMHSAGVYQMVGYTVVTFYGDMGGGTRHLFFDQSGQVTLAEAFFLVNQVLLRKLETNYPETARKNIDNYDHEGGLGARLRAVGAPDRDSLGLLWDRDTVAFYGDPAWSVRGLPADKAWSCAFEQDGDEAVFRIRTTAAGTWPYRGVLAVLPRWVEGPRVTAGVEHDPLVTECFLHVPLAGAFEAGEEVVVRFTGAAMRPE